MTIARTPEQFWAHVDKSGECWIWTASRNPRGYGTCTGPEGTKTAHRAGYVFQHGPIPERAFVCHHCDNPPCVRGDHLYAGDVHTNSADVRNRGRAVSRPPRGDAAPSRVRRAELEAELGIEASKAFWLRARESFGLTQAQFADALGCSLITIKNAESGRHFPGFQQHQRLKRLLGLPIATPLEVLRERLRESHFA